MNEKIKMQHDKPGYVLFLIFSILSVCTLLITLYFSKATTYKDLTHIIITQEKATQLAISSSALGQSILYASEESQDDKSQSTDYNQKILQQSLPYIIHTTQHELQKDVDGIDGTIKMNMFCENGKLNINSFYDFTQKKFVNEGESGDRKEFCKWLFTQISKVTQQPSLFEPFEKFLQTRTFDLNDVTELLSIQEFADVFKDTVFYIPEKQNNTKLYLTDLFTTSTSEDKINPWFFSHSCRVLFNLPASLSLTADELKQLLLSYKKDVNWEKDWDSSLKILYKKEYSVLPQEIKSMLTTDFEANIFSLLIETIIGETTSTIFTILKANTKNKPTIFDIIKVYQL